MRFFCVPTLVTVRNAPPTSATGNLRLIARVKKPDYVEPAIVWNDEDFDTGVTNFGVANYEGTAKLKVKAPAVRPALKCPLPRMSRWRMSRDAADHLRLSLQCMHAPSRCRSSCRAKLAMHGWPTPSRVCGHLEHCGT